jgi:ankyrin repeat protein
VRMLLERGANIYTPTGCGGTVMEFATTNEIVQIFLDHGLDINAHDKFGMTVLIRSVGVGGSHVPSIAFLLGHGADPNARADFGFSVLTALRLAQISGKTNEVELLRKAGATD